MLVKRLSVTRLWEATQVELHGSYSTDRVLELASYARDTSWTRAVFVVLLAPAPCLVVTLVIDVQQLADPSEGFQANTIFFLREFYCSIVTTAVSIHLFRTRMKGALEYPLARMIRDTILVALSMTSYLYLLAVGIGFPVPFTSVLLAPAWATLMVIAVAIQWAKRIKETPQAPAMLMDVAKLLVCDVLLILIYPPYYYLFTTLSSTGQMGFTLLLPMIKLAMRNIFSRAITRLGDETPCLVIFNADMFGLLFMSYCMQHSLSVVTTLELMLADVVIMGLSLRDIQVALSGLGELEDKVEASNVWRQCQDTAAMLRLGGRKSVMLERASVLLETNLQAATESDKSSLCARAVGPTLEDVKLDGGSEPETTSSSYRSFALVSSPLRLGRRWLRRSRVRPKVNADGSSGVPMSLAYTRKVRRVLYMAEFMLLLNYVEVVIPLVFSLFLVATYHLRNREYYSVFDDVDDHQLFQTLKSVVLYIFLQLISLLLLFVILKRMLRVSPLQLIAFVLEKQVHYIQISLVFWSMYIVQCTLRHQGYDYTFQFAWLHSVSSDSQAG